MDTPERARPYWHIDAKWIVGLLLFVVLHLTLLVYLVYQLTSERLAVDAMSMAAALALSPEGLDAPGDFEQIMAELRANPDQARQLIPGLDITVRYADVADLSPRAARLYVMRQFVEPIYRNGTEGLADLATTPEMRQSITEGGALLDILWLENHQRIQRGLIGLASAGLVLLGLLVTFSYRWGRLSNPAILFLIVSLPGALVLSILGRAEPSVVDREGGVTSMVSGLLSNVLPPVARAVGPRFVWLALGSLALLVIAVIGAIVRAATAPRPET